MARIPVERIPKEPVPDALEQILLDINRVVVAFSGGADSALLAHAANAVLGPERVHVVLSLIHI